MRVCVRAPLRSYSCRHRVLPAHHTTSPARSTFRQLAVCGRPSRPSTRTWPSASPNSQQPTTSATSDGSSLEVVYLSVKFKCNTA
uniref:MIP33016p1 n=1 Tax=Drosophila melanogaster TaxID=7227 RepID=G4LU50_DROME|nr:MIP33016p1 [Drosophila melanogaster]